MKRTISCILAITTAAAIGIVTVVATPQDKDDWDSPNAIIPEEERIEANNIHEISTQVPGKIVFLKVNSRGGFVTKGEEVVRLDSELIEDQYEEAKAKAESEVLIKFAEHALEAARLKLKTKLQRNENGGGPFSVFSEDEIRELELNVVKAAAELEKATEDKMLAGLTKNTKETELKQYSVKAEISGIVTETHKKGVGAGVTQGAPIITITNLDRVHAIMKVKPEYFSRINLGDTVLVRHKSVATPARGNPSRQGPSLPEESTTSVRNPVTTKSDLMTFRGKVTYIGSSDFGEKNLMEVEAEIENVEVSPGKFELRAGAFIDARIIPQ